MKTAVLAVLGMLLLLPASAAASGPLNPITVNESATDAPLESSGDAQLECVSESSGEGCSLRAAVELANYESKEYGIVVTIDVPGETFGNTQSYGTFTIETGASIVISGAGAGVTKIEGAGEEFQRTSIFTVDGGASLTVKNLTLLHGDAEGSRGYGGAIYAYEGTSVTVEGSAIEDNTADHNGGGIFARDDSYLHEGASITIKSSTITGNLAKVSREEAEGGDGGGIYGEPGTSITIESSTISGNRAERNGGGVAAGTGELITTTECGEEDASPRASHGKADVVAAGPSGNIGLTIKQSTIEGNTAEGDGDDFEIGGGGGVYVSQGAEEECFREDADGAHAKPAISSSPEDSITIEQSKILDNDATRGDGGGVLEFNFGGCVESSVDGLTVTQSTIEGNTAEGSDGDGDGGGIYTASEFDDCFGARSAHSAGAHAKPASDDFLAEESGLTVEQSTIANNRAGAEGGGDGGGIYEDVEEDDAIVNSTIADNIAGEAGGGVFAGEEDFAALTSDTVADNESENEDAGNLVAEDDGGIAVRNTIVAEEQDSGQGNCEGNVESLVPDAGYNLDYPSEAREDSSSDTCGLSASDQDLVDVEPGFEGGLASNGGPTQTIALAPTSKAIGVVPLAEDCEVSSPEGPGLVDQRGEPRPGIAGDGCDIGAYEYQGGHVQPKAEVSLSLSPASEEQEAGATHTHSVTATVSEGETPAVRSDAAEGGSSSLDVTFTVSGQNSGVAGTCATPEGAADPTCATNSAGQVVFTYPDTNGAGSDAIEATASAHGATGRATAAMVWKQPKAATTSTPAASASVLPFKAEVPPACTSKRDITIHIQHVKQLGVVSAVVSVDGHAKRTLKGRALTTAIDLQGLPTGTFTVKIVARLRDGRTLTGKRVYHTCRATPLPGRSYLPL